MVERDEMASEPPAVGSGRGIAGRVLLVALTLWALALIVPGLYRVVDPLASFGLSVDNDGLVIDTVVPFTSEAESPAARAGIVPRRPGRPAGDALHPLGLARLRRHAGAVRRAGRAALRSARQPRSTS